MTAISRVRSVLANEDVIAIEVISDLGRRSLREVLEDEQQELNLHDIHKLWTRLHLTACSSAGLDTHLTASCNAICVFLRCTCQSTREELRNFSFSTKIWFQAFEVVHRAFGDGKNKAAVLVLEMLVQVLHDHPNQSDSAMILRKAIGEMVIYIATGQPVIRLKEACIILSCCLKNAQSIVPLSEYFEAISPQVESIIDRRCYQAGIQVPSTLSSRHRLLWKFLQALLQTASINESRTAAIKLFSLLCTKTEKIDLSENVDTASSVIESYLNANDDALKTLSADVFPAVLNTRYQFEKFQDQFDPSMRFSFSRLSIFLAVLETGRSKGFLNENDLSNIVGKTLAGKSVDNGLQEWEYAGFDCLLKCDVPTIRLQAYRLLTASNATNAAVPVAILNCLTRSFKYLHDDSNSAYRGEYISISRRLVRRLQCGGHAAQKSEHSANMSNTSQVRAEDALFLSDWHTFLCLELLPHASYQRHILALQTLHLIMPIILSAGEQVLSTASTEVLVTTLLNLLFDPFDDVREYATSLLVTLSPHHQFLLGSILSDLRLVDRSQDLSASTNRAGHADALGRVIMLDAFNSGLSPSCTPESGTQNPPTKSTIKAIALSIDQYLHKVDHLSPSSEFPVHGTLIALSYIVRLSRQESIKVDTELITILLKICSRTWTLVQDVLCIDSPETEADEEDEITSGGPKDLLAYTWRALRDSSLMMQALVETQIAQYKLCQSVSSLCFEQLVRLRHRGAFSAVAQTFYLCCQYSRSAENEHCRTLNAPLLEAAFNEIYRQSHKLTRRSAALPSLFMALLDSQDQQQFLRGIQQLVQIAYTDPYGQSDANSGLQLPQVHALNCLKDAMTNSRFRAITESLVVEMLNLASKCLACDIWPIRNCGLMLFRACISRLTPDSSSLYGVQATSLVGTEIKTPLAVAVSLLDQPESNGMDNLSRQIQPTDVQSEAVFAALDLLSRIPYQSEHESAIQDLIKAQFSNRLWAVREQAARVEAARSCMSANVTNPNLSVTWTDTVSSNELHGRLLCCRYTLSLMWSQFDKSEKEQRVRDIISEAEENDTNLPISQLHPIVVAAFLDLLNDLFAFTLKDSLETSILVDFSLRLESILSRHKGHSNSSMLQRAKALNYAYIEVCGLKTSESNSGLLAAESRFIDIVRSDYDAALFVIEELMTRSVKDDPVRTSHILDRVFSNCDSPNVRAAALMALIGQRLNHSDSSSPTEFVGSISTTMSWHAESRDLRNSQIRFNASKIRQAIASSSSDSGEDLAAQIRALRVSQQDEVETPTRLQAAEAIADLVPAICWGKDSKVKEHNKLQLLFLLYDFLNDDDEHVRGTAASALSEIIRTQNQAHSVVISGALGARKALCNAITTSYGRSALLTANIYLRLIGAVSRPVVSESETVLSYCKINPISEIYDRTLQRANDLFAEERQNLYIDDIEEINTWAVAARQQSLRAMGQSVSRQLQQWTSEGMQFLKSKLEQESQMFRMGSSGLDTQGHQQNSVLHPAGLTYNVDILILVVRVVTIAGVLQHYEQVDGGVARVSSADQDNLMQQLRDMREVVKDYRVHHYVLNALDSAIQD